MECILFQKTVKIKINCFKKPVDQDPHCYFTFLVNICLLMGPQREKTCLPEFANNTGAVQPADPRSLIMAFVIPFLESSICIHDSAGLCS